jgi:ElaB/YqjD/DUF883 family membrane-anchored ribosome-binding protein
MRMNVLNIMATAEKTNTESENYMAEAGQRTTEFENELTEQGKAAAGRLAQALDTAKVKVQESTVASAKATDRAIREHPYESLGVAFGLGVLIGVLIARR